MTVGTFASRDHRRGSAPQADHVAAIALGGLAIWLTLIGAFGVVVGVGSGGMLTILGLPGWFLARPIWKRDQNIRGLGLAYCLVTGVILAGAILGSFGPQPVRPETERYAHLASFVLTLLGALGAAVPLIVATIALLVVIRRRPREECPAFADGAAESDRG